MNDLPAVQHLCGHNFTEARLRGTDLKAFTVRGGKPENLKGNAPEGPFIVLAFDSLELARKWASSPEYTALVPLRDQAADTRAFIMEGAGP